MATPPVGHSFVAAVSRLRLPGNHLTNRHSGSRSGERPYRRYRRVVLVLAFGLSSLGHGLELEPCELTGSDGHGRVAAECGRLDVPVHRDSADDATLSLFVARVPALAADPAADAFTVINGGPGASSVDLYVDLEGAFADIHRQRDIVIVDQRGTGRSAPLECAELEDMAHDFEPERIRAATRRCLAGLSHDPRAFTTQAAVADLEAVRHALGYPALSLYGVSYGTRVVQLFLQRHPEAARLAVLDGVVPPGLALGPDIATNAQDALDTHLARCARDEGCRDAFPQLGRDFERLGSQLKRHPVDLALPHPVTGRVEPFTLRYGHLATTLRLLSYAPETAALIPVVIGEAANHGNYLPIASQALQLERALGASISFGMHNSVVCSEDVPFWEDLDARLPVLEASYLGADQVRALETVCSVWPAGPADPQLRNPQPASQPVLLLSGELDPITPPRYAQASARHLSNSRHLVAPGQGHGVIARGCVPELVADFVTRQDPRAVAADCLERLAADAYFVNLLGPPP